jgi:hypothetical protein
MLRRLPDHPLPSSPFRGQSAALKRCLFLYKPQPLFGQIISHHLATQFSLAFLPSN